MIGAAAGAILAFTPAKAIEYSTPTPPEINLEAITGGEILMRWQIPLLPRLETTISFESGWKMILKSDRLDGKKVEFTTGTADNGTSVHLSKEGATNYITTISEASNGTQIERTRYIADSESIPAGTISETKPIPHQLHGYQGFLYTPTYRYPSGRERKATSSFLGTKVQDGVEYSINQLGYIDGNGPLQMDFIVMDSQTARYSLNEKTAFRLDGLHLLDGNIVSYGEESLLDLVYEFCKTGNEVSVEEGYFGRDPARSLYPDYVNVSCTIDYTTYRKGWGRNSWGEGWQFQNYTSGSGAEVSDVSENGNRYVTVENPSLELRLQYGPFMGEGTMIPDVHGVMYKKQLDPQFITYDPDAKQITINIPDEFLTRVDIPQGISAQFQIPQTLILNNGLLKAKE